MDKPFISLTSDFGVQTQGVGIMEGVILSIAPNANVIHLMHGLPQFDITAAARTMETVQFLPIGFHVCVCDPTVGTDRKAIICQTSRGDYLIGPDNGVLIPATKRLGGLEKVYEITNRKYMKEPVSPIFHGRDVFSPAAAYLSIGVQISEFGPQINIDILTGPPYFEAEISKKYITAKIIQVNRFGSLHLNILHEVWDQLEISKIESLYIKTKMHGVIKLAVCHTFGNAPKGSHVILKDDYGRVEIAKNMGSFVEDYPMKVGDDINVIIDQ